MPRKPVKVSKKRPNTKGVAVLKDSRFLLIWRAKSAKPWAPFTVFLLDSTERKRSFYFSWNGERLSNGADTERLCGEQPVIAREVLAFLVSNKARFWRPMRGRGDA